MLNVNFSHERLTLAVTNVVGITIAVLVTILPALNRFINRYRLKLDNNVGCCYECVSYCRHLLLVKRRKRGIYERTLFKV